MISIRRTGHRAAAGFLSVWILLLSLTALAALSPVQPAADEAADSGSLMTDGMLTVDVGHVSDGYLLVRCEPESARMRLRLSHKKGELYYDLELDGSYVSIPLQYGSGSYDLDLFKNTSGKKYSAEGSISLKAELENEASAYLYPNQYVNYDDSYEAVSVAHEICAGLTGDKEKAEAVFGYITSNCTYDWNRAKSVQSGQLPDIRYLMDNRMGICQDIAATMACMLRVEGVPCKLVIGYIGKYYHAWCGVYIDGEEVLYDPTVALGGAPDKMKYSVERWY